MGHSRDVSERKQSLKSVDLIQRVEYCARPLGQRESIFFNREHKRVRQTESYDPALFGSSFVNRKVSRKSRASQTSQAHMKEEVVCYTRSWRAYYLEARRASSSTVNVSVINEGNQPAK